MSPTVVTLGEVMLRLSVEPGDRIESAPQLAAGVAGAEANTAVALARMGVPAAWISRLPDNALGHRAERALRGLGVDVSGISWADDGRIGTFFVELGRSPRPTTVIYDRKGSAASEMTTADVPWGMVEDASAAYITGITPALSATCLEVTKEFMSRAREAGTIVVFDVNYRSKLWPADIARPVLTDMAGHADAVIVSEEDAREVFRLDGDVESLLSQMATLAGVRDVAMTRGAAGAAWRSGSDWGMVEPVPAEVVDPIGAGDAFAAGAIIGLLDDDLASGAALGAAMGAIQVGLRGDLFVSDPDEVAAIRARSGRDVAR